MTETTDIKALRDSAECMANLLDNLAGYEPSDIDMDTVELRFEDEGGCDTGCDISIVGTAQQSADIIRSLLDQLDAELQRVADERALNTHLDRAIRQSEGVNANLRRQVERAEAELATLRGTQEPDHYRYSCGSCGYETLAYTSKCPTCNYHKIEEEPLFTRPPKPVVVMPTEPTATMQAAGANAIRFETTPINKLFTANAVWRAMKAAFESEAAGIVVKDGE